MQNEAAEPAELEERQPNPRLMGAGRVLYVAGALALTEPGPAAAGIVVTDADGQMLAHRALYLGRATQAEATVRAFLAALQVARTNAMEAPVFRLDQADVVHALDGTEGKSLAELVPALASAVEESRATLPGHHVELVRTAGNLARPVALAPLVEWLPSRTRRAEALRVTPVGPHTYDVASESQPGQTYRVVLGQTGVDGDEPVQCQCADFQYRGIPCKHLLAVAREAGSVDQLFHLEPGHPGQDRPPDVRAA